MTLAPPADHPVAGRGPGSPEQAADVAPPADCRRPGEQSHRPLTPPPHSPGPGSGGSRRGGASVPLKDSIKGHRSKRMKKGRGGEKGGECDLWRKVGGASDATGSF